jgi:hypothetical protein
MARFIGLSLVLSVSSPAARRPYSEPPVFNAIIKVVPIQRSPHKNLHLGEEQ